MSKIEKIAVDAKALLYFGKAYVRTFWVILDQTCFQVCGYTRFVESVQGTWEKGIE